MSQRNLRNNRYDRAGERPYRRANPLVRLWRWRTEIALLAAAVTVVAVVVHSLGEGRWWPSLILAAPSVSRRPPASDETG
ncbi:hypothetical protein ACFQX6_38760 [Streptosporangium lutulentum]